MATKATLEELGTYSQAEFNLRGMVKDGVRSATEAARRIQAIADGQPDPSVPSEFESTLTPSGFTPVELQVARLRRWNQRWRLNGYFSATQIHDAMASAPLFKWEPPLVAVTLCWAMNSIGQTVDSQKAVLRWEYGDKLYLSDALRTEPEYLSPAEGAPEFVPNRLWWEVMDLDANRDMAPDQVPAATAAGLEVFAVACHHRAYIKRHNGRVPYLDVPGLRVIVPGRSYPCAPYVHGYSDGGVGVDVYPADNPDSNYAEPVVMR